MQKLTSSYQINSPLKVLQYIILVSVILYFGKTLLIPLSFSVLISFMLFPVCKWLEKKGLAKNLSVLISLLIVFMLFVLIIYLLSIQIIAFSKEWAPFKVKLIEAFNTTSDYFSSHFGISAEKQFDYFKNIIDNSSVSLFTAVKTVLYSFSESIFFFLIIPVFSALILIHRQMLAKVLYQIFPSNKTETIHEILIKTIDSYYIFIKGMGLVYLIVGTLNSIGLVILGIPHPFLFGFIASILTFIPYIGILISSILPIAISWITFNSIWYPVGVIVVFTIVQILEAYLIFPFIVGKGLKINTLVIMIMITLGGMIWGAAGMILFIPFTGIAKLIADRTESLKTLALLLGDGTTKDRKLG
jgi:predicted PurR-regulated permease PerM